MLDAQTTPPRCWTPAVLLAGLAARGERPAVLTLAGDTLHALSGADLADMARRLATGLARAGVASQQPIALFAPNTPRWVIARLAIGAAGALPVAIDDLATPEEAEAVLRDAGCRWLLTTASHAAQLAPRLAPDLPRIVLLDDEASPEGWRALLADQPAPLPETPPEAPAMVVYTSGTTGVPKSFTLSHANLHANLAGVLGHGLIGPTDRVLLPLPLHHVYPLLIGLLTPLAAGAAMVLPEAVTGPEILRALRTAQATAIVGVPRLYAALLGGLEAQVAARGAIARRLFAIMLAVSLGLRRRGIHAGRRLFRPLHTQFGPELRLMVSGGAKLEGALIWRLEALGWRVLSGYGLAETASMFTGNLPERQRIGSEGQPIVAGSELRIATPDVDGGGEIELRGANVFAGYRNDPNANATAFTADGWFRTGDLGRVDADGYLHVTGRAKEMIVLGGGKNIFPEELERAYAANPFITEIAVLERAGALVAIVVPNLDAIRASGNPPVEDVLRVTLAETAQALPSYQRLAGFAVAREKLPRTRLDKYRRFLLPEMYDRLRRGGAPERPAGPPSPEDVALLAAAGAREVWDILQARFPDRPLSLDAHPQLDLGLDSLEWVTLSLEIERRVGLHLSGEEMAGFATLREVLERAARGAAAPDISARPTAPTEAEVERWTTPAGTVAASLRTAAWIADRALSRLLFRLQGRGIEHLPAAGPFVVVANHVSDLDPALVAAALPLDRARRVWWGGTTARLFRGPVGRWLARVFQVFPVDDRNPQATVMMARSVLTRGEALVWFPEAWRSPDGRLQRFLPGIGLILDGLDAVPVLPALIEGAFEAMPRTRRLPRPHPVKVTFGPALTLRELAGDAPAQLRPARIADGLHEAVAGLAHPARGNRR